MISFHEKLWTITKKAEVVYIGRNYKDCAAWIYKNGLEFNSAYTIKGGVQT